MIQHFLHKTLSLMRMGEEWCQRMIAGLIEAGRTLSYVETVNSSQADTIHKAIKNTDVTVLKREFERCVRRILKKLGIRKVTLAIDSTDDPYWGKYGSSNTRAKVHVKSEESWQYLTLSIVEPQIIPLMSVPYRQVDDQDEITIDLINYAKTLPFDIDLFLFDRGFYHAKLIDFLESRRGADPTPYLILARKTQKVQEYLSLSKKKLNSFEHEFKYSQEKSTWKPKTTIVTCMQIPWKAGKKPLDWCFATNLRASLGLIGIYKKRWGIETGFRIHDESKVKTKSSNPMIRYFYHLFSMVLILSWRVRITFKGVIVFKRFLRIVEFALRKQIGHQPP